MIVRSHFELLHRYRCWPFACRPYFTTSGLPHSGHCTATTATAPPHSRDVQHELSYTYSTVLVHHPVKKRAEFFLRYSFKKGDLTFSSYTVTFWVLTIGGCETFCTFVRSTPIIWSKTIEASNNGRGLWADLRVSSRPHAFAECMTKCGTSCARAHAEMRGVARATAYPLRGPHAGSLDLIGGSMEENTE